MSAALRTPTRDTTPLDVLLASVPSLPRAILSRLTARMINRMDDLDGDIDLKPDEDRRSAGDDDLDGVLVGTLH